MSERRKRPPVRIDADFVRRMGDGVSQPSVWAKLSRPAAKVIVALLAHVDRDGGCWPGVRTLAELAGLGRTATYDALRELGGLGVVRTEATGGGRGDGGQYRRTRRRVTVRDGELIDPSTVRRSEGDPSAKPYRAVRQSEHSRPRERPQNHGHRNQRQKPHAIEPSDGASRNGSSDGLRDVRPHELTVMGRLIERYCRWRGCERPTEIDADLLQFVAAAVHAAEATPRIGKPIRDRPALFASMVRAGDFAKVTQAEEDTARRRLSAHLHGTPPKPRRKPYDWTG